MNNQVDIRLKNIQHKLQQLLKQYQLLQKENVQLQTDLERSKLVIQSKTEQLNLLQQKADVLKLGIDSWSGEDKKGFEKRIDGYLKEIDTCLALLNTE